MSEVLSERRGDVLLLTLNRPAKANAMNQAMHAALVAGLEAAGADDGVHAVVLAAAGEKVFSAGADLKEFAELERGHGARQRRALLRRTLFAALDCPKPMVAAVQGKALGAGCMLALLADEVVMADGAELGLPEIAHGIPTPVGFVILAARGGLPLARRMVQRGQPLAASEAREAGLVDEVVAPEALQPSALARARQLVPLAGFPYRANKQFINAALRAAVLAALAEADRLQPSADGLQPS